MSELLQAAGHTVTACASGFDARTHIAATRFDAAVVDWALPGVSGRDLVIALEAAQRHTPVIVVTGYGENVVSGTLQSRQVRAVLRQLVTAYPRLRAALPDIELVLLVGGYAQGTAYLWSESGTLLATASQSLAIKLWGR